MVHYLAFMKKYNPDADAVDSLNVLSYYNTASTATRWRTDAGEPDASGDAFAAVPCADAIAGHHPQQ
jgi:hypothetical protein